MADIRSRMRPGRAAYRFVPWYAALISLMVSSVIVRPMSGVDLGRGLLKFNAYHVETANVSTVEFNGGYEATAAGEPCASAFW